MEVERWRHIEQLYHQALERSLPERDSFLAIACDGDECLRDEVESLLRLNSKADQFMEMPALGIAAQLLSNETFPDAIGSKLAHYDILEKLGSGGMGVVYKARDEHLHRFVAVKVLPETFANDSERLKRFEREARSASALNHPNVITIYDVAHVHSAPYIVMEFVEGQTLRQMISTGPLPMTVVMRLAEQLAEGLSRVHAAGLIHRDLKPENVMVRHDGLAKILDFGLAKIIPSIDDPSEPQTMSDKTHSGLVGTLSYIAPEQILRQPVDFRADQFSLGCILYEMATGKCAFRRATPIQTLSSIVREEVQPLRDLRNDSPIQLCRVVQRCLSKDPGERYQSTQDLARELGEMRVAQLELTGLKTESPARRARYLAAIMVVLVTVAGIAMNRVLRVHPSDGHSRQVKSLAVMPLENLSRAEQDGYLADGMTEELITVIGRTISPLKVISRDTMMRYKEVRKGVSEIASELAVDAVLEGSVLLAGQRVRISERLIHGKTQEVLWANSYDGDTEDVLTLQRQVARDVAHEINIKSTPEEESRPALSEKVNSEAHWDYLVGLYHYNNRFRGNAEELRKSTEFFDHAIQKDPNYAPAYAARADSYIVQSQWGILLPSDAYPAAKEDVMTSLRLDGGRGEPHASLGRILTNYDWNWVQAEAEFKRAIQLSPSYSEAYLWYSQLLSYTGRHDEARDLIQQALERDRLSLPLNMSLGFALYMARRYELSIQQYQRALDLDSDSAQTVIGLGEAYEMAGKYQQAFEEYQKWARNGGMPKSRISKLELAYKTSGIRGYWQKRLEMEIEDEKSGEIWTYEMASLYARVGNTQQALIWLEKAYQEHQDRVSGLKVDPVFDSLRSHSKFVDLIRRLGFP